MSDKRRPCRKQKRMENKQKLEPRNNGRQYIYKLETGWGATSKNSWKLKIMIEKVKTNQQQS